MRLVAPLSADQAGHAPGPNDLSSTETGREPSRRDGSMARARESARDKRQKRALLPRPRKSRRSGALTQRSSMLRSLIAKRPKTAIATSRLIAAARTAAARRSTSSSYQYETAK